MYHQKQNLSIFFCRKKHGFDSIRGPLAWLEEARLCIKCCIVKKAQHPLLSYIDENKFKVFLFDIGLLNCLLDIPGESILEKRIGHYKGYIFENFIAQEIYAKTNKRLISWNEGIAEVEFLITKGADIIPIEVKSAAKSKRARSLDSFIKRYHPPLAYKLTRGNYGYEPERKIVTVPVYCGEKIFT
ncbi:MAG: DUF4143 domain-containing protein [Chitinivibrionales bacterium]|nr:DUF4143 domain-containing protein [Chitinivibrionales bacterium]